MLLNDIQRWTCSKSSCKCCLKINSNNEITESNTNHNHDKIEENINKRQALSSRLIWRKIAKKRHKTHTILGSMNYKTYDNEQFVFVNNSVRSIIGFSTERNLEVLCDVTDIYMYETFNVCLKYFIQLFTIYEFKNDVYIPLIFFLLPNKRNTTYELAFKYLVDYCSFHGMTLPPI